MSWWHDTGTGMIFEFGSLGLSYFRRKSRKLYRERNKETQEEEEAEGEENTYNQAVETTVRYLWADVGREALVRWGSKQVKKVKPVGGDSGDL